MTFLEFEELIARCVHEVKETEAVYLRTLSDFRTHYCSVIQGIARGDQGWRARNELGLSLRQVESLCGNPLSNVVRVHEKLRDYINPPHGDDDQHGMTADEKVSRIAHAILSLQNEDFAAYLQYIVAYQSGHRHFNTTNKNNPTNSFLGIWERVSQEHASLRGRCVLGVLVCPMGRLPRYKLLLTQMLSTIPVDSRGHFLLTCAVEFLTVQLSAMNTRFRAILAV